MTLKIEKANRAMGYYDTISRIFSKVDRQNAYAKAAVDAKDVAGLEQHATTLVSFAEDGLERLKKLRGYDGDEELLSNAKTMLEFYKHEGQTTYPANIDFYLQSDTFEKAQKKINAIKESDRKQEDIDEYNKAVNSYNKTVKELNRTNNASYKTHKQLLKTWNKQTGKFFDKHS